MQPDDPRLVNNPITGKAGWKDRAVPMALHGDGASFTMKNNKLLAISCSFLLGTGWSSRSTFLLAVFTGINRTFGSLHGGLENDTWHVIWLHIVRPTRSLVDPVLTSAIRVHSIFARSLLLKMSQEFKRRVFHV